MFRADTQVRLPMDQANHLIVSLLMDPKQYINTRNNPIGRGLKTNLVANPSINPGGDKLDLHSAVTGMTKKHGK